MFYFEIETEKGIIIICPCYNSELFCDDALKRLLLSDDGRQIILSCAVSLNNDKLSLKVCAL